MAEPPLNRLHSMASVVRHAASSASTQGIRPMPSMDVRKLFSRAAMAQEPSEDDSGPGLQNNLRQNSRLAELLTFDGCPELLRGSQLATVMSRCSEIFRNSSGSAATYEMSEQVESLHAFISHNWVVPRWKKNITLVYYFNFRLAAILTMAVFGYPCFWYCFLRPENKIGDAEEGSSSSRQAADSGEKNSGFYYSPFFVPVFLFWMVFVRDIQAKLRIKSPPVFLDKTCIHQTDKKIQAEGIQKLGAYLANCEKMVVIYTPIYLEKLWTVYEVASFLSLHPNPDSMKYVPVTKALLFMECVLGLYSIDMASALIWHTMKPVMQGIPRVGVRIILFSVTVGPMMMKVLRGWALEESGDTIGRVIKWFDVRKAKCFAPMDREVVYSNIVLFMQERKLVPPDAEDQEKAALDAFNELVQKKLPKAFSASAKLGGYSSFSYGHCVWLGMLVLVPGSLDESEPVIGHRLAELVYIWHMIFVWMPICFLIMEICASGKQNLEGISEWGWLQLTMLFCVIMPFSLVAYVLDMIMREVSGITRNFEMTMPQQRKLHEPNYVLWTVYVLSAPLCTAVAWTLFHDAGLHKCRRRWFGVRRGASRSNLEELELSEFATASAQMGTSLTMPIDEEP